VVNSYPGRQKRMFGNSILNAGRIGKSYLLYFSEQVLR